METEGGAGGKFRKRPFRRSQATPYERPPSAFRPGLRLASEDGGRTGWLARLVDPASRVIAGGATRFFSTVFRKRLGAPPTPPPQMETTKTTLTPQEKDPESKEEVRDASSDKILTPKVHDQGDKDEQTFKVNIKTNSENNGISELEQLLNQRTFTRDEFERLTELLRSRTAGLSTDGRDQKVEASTSKQDISGGKEEKAAAMEKENEIWTSKLFSSTPKPHSSLKLSSGAVPESEERITSPTEVAKAYMGSRSSKPALPLTVHSMSRRESVSLASPQMQLKSSDTSVGPRPTIQLAGLPQNGLRTPRTQGRTALYKMSRSPYFKAQTLASEKGHALSDGGCDVFPRSPLVRSDLSLSSGKQALKRRSSVLDSDLGSIGPIRRIRQKSSLGSSSKELIMSSSGRYLSTSMNGLQNSVASTQKPSASDSSKYMILEDADKRENRFSCVPRQSTQMAGRILELVDQLVQSPKKKVSELKVGATVESPPKLTFDMLNQEALKSVKDIDSAKVLSVQENGKVDGGSESIPFKGLKPPASPVQYKPETNGPMRLATSGTSAANGMDITTTITTEKKYGRPMGSPAALVPGAVSLQKKPAFKMQAPETSLELDSDGQGVEDASGNPASEKENMKVPPEKTKPVASEELIQETSWVSSSSSKPDSGLMPRKDTHKLQVKVTRRDNGFTFPVACSESSSQAPPTPSMSLTFLEQSVPAKEEPVSSVFSFGSRNASALSSTTTSTGGTAGLKFSFAPSTKSEVSVSAAAPTITTKELLSTTKVADTDNVNEAVNVGGLFPSLPASTAPVFAFGTSSSTSLSNGTLDAKSSASAVSSSPISEPSDNLPGAIASSVSVTQSIFASPSAPASTKLPTFNTTPTPAIVTVATADCTDTGTVRTDTKDSEKPLKSPTFGLNNLSSGASATFSSSGSSNIFSFGAKAPSSSPASTSGQFFGLQPSHAETATSGQSEGSMFSLSAAAPVTTVASSVFTFGSSGFGSSSSTSTFSFAPSSGAAQSSSMLFTSNASASGPSSGLSFAPSATGSSIFGSSGGSSFALTAPATNLFGSSSSLSFPSSASSPSLFSSTTSQASSSIFGFGSSTSSQSTPSIFGSGAATTSSQSTPTNFGSGAGTTVFSFGQTSAAPTSPINFGASSSAPFSFTMSASTSTSAPVFGTQTPVFGSSLGNDQMNVEDSSMTEDTTQNAVPVAPVFGQAANQPMASGITFGPSSLQPTTFQFGSQPTPAFPQAQSPFQAPGNLEFAAGGSFSLGSGGGDKSGRRIVKVKRDKLRKK